MVENWPMEKHQSQTYLQMYSTKYSRNGASRSYKKKNYLRREEARLPPHFILGNECNLDIKTRQGHRTIENYGSHKLGREK